MHPRSRQGNSFMRTTAPVAMVRTLKASPIGVVVLTPEESAAPPHDDTGHTWHHSDRMLFQITKGGVGAVVPGYESDMPAFGEDLTDAEIEAILVYIKSTWPERQREFQAEVSANDTGG